MMQLDHVQKRRDGVVAQHNWRQANKDFVPDLADSLSKSGEHQMGGAPMTLKSVHLQKAVFRFADLSAANLNGADLTGAALQHACLREASLEEANLRDAKLDYADLGVTNLNKARLSAASLHLTNLESADLRGADLTGADLLHARLIDADLRGADLRSARLDHADLAGVDLTGANLRGASLHHVKNLTRAQLKVARKTQSTILPPHLQGRSSPPAKTKGNEKKATLKTRKVPVVARLSSPEEKALAAGAVVAALIIVGPSWKGSIEAIPLDPIDFSAADALSASPANPVVTNDSHPNAVLRTLQVSQPMVDVVPFDTIRRPLRPVANVRTLTAREIAKDPNVDHPAIASYYGEEFAGRPTASGEIFNPSALTAAHRSLSFGTRVLVTHLRNGRSVIVRINDRGPFIKGRSIDLSAGAAAAIGMDGIARVHLSVLR